MKVKVKDLDFKYVSSLGLFTGDFSKLVPGKEYTLREKRVHSYYTEYFLEELRGSFSSEWFEEVDDSSDEQVFLAFVKKVPVEGKRCECWKVEEDGSLVDWSMSMARSVVRVRSNLYKVTTANSIYMVQVV